LEEVLRTGRGLDLHHVLEDPQAWSDYQRGMLEIARLDAPVVAKSVSVPHGATRLLDVGGGHGLFGAAVCRQHPGLRSTVLDLPASLDAARELARECGISELVDHHACDILRDAWGADSDVALFCNVLHHFAPPDVAAILQRSRAALRAGGTVAVWEIERPRRDARPTDGDGAALYFRLTSTGGAYHADEYAAWLQAAGFGRLRIRRPWLTPGKILVTAHVR
jgi:2-polyprenyl-3-methyl-5-hydroxy-6-metoxy-1,4-benzoquinol methylase